MLKKVLKFVGLILLFVFFSLLYVVYLMIYRPVLAQDKKLTDKDHKDFFAVTSDNIKIHACFYKGKLNNPVILLCHGHGVTMNHLNDMVAFLRKQGFPLLLLDFRAHGKSGGKLTSIGLYEWRDIRAVLDKAKTLNYINDKTDIVAYGRSMGAATLVNGAKHLSEIKAYILESCFEKLRNIAARDGKFYFRLPDTPLTDFIFWVVEKVTHIPYSQDCPVNKIEYLKNKPVFLIHDELDHRANAQAFNALKRHLPGAKTWISKNSRHVKAHKVNKEEFEKKFLNFIKSCNFK